MFIDRSGGQVNRPDRSGGQNFCVRDPFTSFLPVGMVAWVTFVMIAHPSVPATTAKDLIALAKKAYPTQLDYASGGSGSPMHIAMEVFKSASGVSLHHIPYRGSITGVLNVVGGRIPVPKGAARPVVDLLNAEIGKALSDPTIRDRLIKLAFEPSLGASDFRASLKIHNY